MTVSDGRKHKFDAIAYWEDRYEEIDDSKSGHIDLPARYNTWLYWRKQAHLSKGMRSAGGTFLGARLLEIAAGSGAWMNFWRRAGIREYIGVDLSPRAIEGLRKKYPSERFEQCDLESYTLDTKAGRGFDVVTAIDVLYYILEDQSFQRTIRDIADVLRPGGWLVLHDVLARSAPLDRGNYIRWRPLAHYEAALSIAGLDIAYRRPSFVFMVQNHNWVGWRGKCMDVIWRRVSYPLIAHFPSIAGLVLGMIDLLACPFCRRGPSMELMICRKRT